LKLFFKALFKPFNGLTLLPLSVIALCHAVSDPPSPSQHDNDDILFNGLETSIAIYRVSPYVFTISHPYRYSQRLWNINTIVTHSV